jgi:uncharacterized membrane protein
MFVPRKMISLKVALLLVVVIVFAILVALFAGLIGPAFTTSIKTQIYSPDNNIGVLNEEGVFNITIQNHVNTSRTFAVIIDADGHVLLNETITTEAMASRNLIITQKLIFTGLWAIELQENGIIIDGYSFTTLTSKVEADMQINQLNNVKFNNTLSLAATIISMLSLGLSIYVAVKQRRTSKHSS